MKKQRTKSIPATLEELLDELQAPEEQLPVWDSAPQHKEHYLKIAPLPKCGFFRLKQIIGDPKAEPPIPAIIPVSNSAWWVGIQKGIYPPPVKLSARTSAWKIQDILDLIQKINEGGVQ